MLAINSVPDHLHLLFGMNPNQSVSDLMRLVKGDSAEFINKNGLVKARFNWQEGYGAFSNSRSQVDAVVKYIHRQKEHHKQVSFKDEYVKILTAYGIDYNDRYLFQNLN